MIQLCIPGRIRPKSSVGFYSRRTWSMDHFGLLQSLEFGCHHIAATGTCILLHHPLVTFFRTMACWGATSGLWRVGYPCSPSLILTCKCWEERLRSPCKPRDRSIFVWWHSLIFTMNKRWNGWVLVVQICLECFLFGGNKLSQETYVQSPNMWRGGRWAHLMFFAHLPLGPATDSYRKPTRSVPSFQGAIPNVPSYKPWAIIYHLLSIITITTIIILILLPSLLASLSLPNHLLQLDQTYHHCQGPYICGNLWHIGIHGGLCLHDDSKSCVHRSKDIPRLLTWSPVHGNQPASNLSSKSLLIYESMPSDKVHQNTIFNLDKQH